VTARALAAWALAATAVVAPAWADATGRRERAVIPGAVGGNRLDVDVVLLAGAAPLAYDVSGEAENARLGAFRGGLADLRLVDAAGREVPWLLVAPPTAEPTWRAGRVVAAGTQAFEVDLGVLARSDRLRLEGLAAPFLERFRLEASGDRSHWLDLVAEATLFDLPEEGLARTEVAFDATELRYLRLTWGGRRRATAFLPGGAELRLVTAVSPPPLVSLPLSLAPVEAEPGTSRWRLALPAAHLPVVAVELSTAAEHVLRPARISEARLATQRRSGASSWGAGEVVPEVLGRTNLRRAVRPEGVAADLRIPVAPPSEPELELEVDDGDNPPLTLSGARAELAPLPWIYFESPDGGPLVARYGDVEARDAPRYDLEAVRAHLGEQPIARAQWQGGELPAAPAPVSAVAAAVPLLGASLADDRSAFRRLVPASPPGSLVSLPLDAAALAHARRDLGDLRLIAVGGTSADGAARQVPYLLEQRAAPLGLELALPASTPTAGDVPSTSRYRFALPFATLPAARLLLRTTTQVFERELRLEVPAGARGEGQTRPLVLTSASWRHADATRPTPALTLELPAEVGATVDLVIEEVDNAPLVLTGARLQLPSRRLRFVHPGGAVELRYGDVARLAPRYDLALLAPRLLGAPARELALGVEMTSAAEPRGQTARWAFWGGLALAVVGLLALLARLLSAG
jgi:hypothetical protein